MTVDDEQRVFVAARRLLEGFDDDKDEGRILERRSDLRVALERVGYAPRPQADRVTGTVESVPLELMGLHRQTSSFCGSCRCLKPESLLEVATPPCTCSCHVPCKHENWHDSNHAGRLCDDCDYEFGCEVSGCEWGASTFVDGHHLCHKHGLIDLVEKTTADTLKRANMERRK